MPRIAFRHRGFVLVYVLLLLALCGILLARTARENLDLHLRLAERARRLEERWTDRSLRKALSASTPELFRTALAEFRSRPADDREPPSSIRASLTLNGRRTDLLLCDETAKLDANVVRRTAPGRAQEILRRLVEGGAGEAVGIRPLAPVSAGGNVPRGDDLEPLFTGGPNLTPFDLAEAARNITVYGAGKLQYHNASDLALETLARLLFEPDEAEALVSIRRAMPEKSLRDATAGIALDEREREAISRYFTEASDTYSVWIFLHGAGRSRASRTVFRENDAAAARVTIW